ncbi:MAG TPA: PEP-CTERM sorting domain-containing protein, partial [Candidatus Angelobacter sp.]|nr:PEP-CTERM sorting domain-containing protein [Candidatus Angelobacter sp.]
TLGFFDGLSVPAMCDDYYHDGTPGDQWIAYLTNLGTPNLAYTRFGNQGIIPYEEVGWLLLEAHKTSASQWPDMNYAVWHIFNPTVPIDSNSQYWINQAMANYRGVDYSKVWIVTPIQIDAPPTGDQEFLFYWDHSPHPPIVPEPASLALVGSGSVAALAAFRRSRKH